MSQIKRKFFLLNFSLLFLSIFLFINCASSELVRFEKNTKTMSDADLLNCYYGINERIKDIDNGIKNEDRSDISENRDIISHQTYFIGGEIYGLMQKEKLVLEELNKRNINP
ncbi:MAG: hypothetical protein GY699_06815 [Desulfobacteraceae bacterium]|nr:hypothetical protein [Desulfobacteraceae bacterium]